MSSLIPAQEAMRMAVNTLLIELPPAEMADYCQRTTSSNSRSSDGSSVTTSGRIAVLTCW